MVSFVHSQETKIGINRHPHKRLISDGTFLFVNYGSQDSAKGDDGNTAPEYDMALIACIR